MRPSKRRRESFKHFRLDVLEGRQLLSGTTASVHVMAMPMTTDVMIDDCSCGDPASPDCASCLTDQAYEDKATLEWQQAIASEKVAPSMGSDHDGVMKLVPLAQATNLAIRSGDWSNPRTWMNGAIPAAGSRVWVMPGRTVRIDGLNDASIKTIRVDGVLSAATDVDTSLKVDTLVVGMGGALEIGSSAAPISLAHTATITIADTGPIDRVWDPTGLSRGVISLGRVDLHGADLTGHVALAKAPKAGDTTLYLASPTTNWRVGDRIVLTGVKYGQDEVRTIRGIGDGTIQVAALSYSHVPPTTLDPVVAAGLRVYVADLERNVRIRSENAADITRRGHFMAMMSPDVDIDATGFYNLGRTDKSALINDSIVDAKGTLVPGTGTNQRGRYAVHFHRLMAGMGSELATIRGSVVEGSPGWGIVNHSSDVEVDDNTVYNAYGAAYVTEAGNETGAFRGNIAIGSGGSSDSLGVTSRVNVNDYGYQGHGFWFQGPYVKVIDNVAANQKKTAFSYWSRGLTEKGVVTTFPSSRLETADLAAGSASVPISALPLFFSGNEAFSTQTALELLAVNQDAAGRANVQSLVEGSKFWNVGSGTYVAYSSNITYRHVTIVGTPSGVHMDSAPSHMGFEDMYIESTSTGILMPTYGTNWVTGGYINSPTAITVPALLSPNEAGRTITIAGTRFGKSTTQVKMDFSAAVSATIDRRAMSLFDKDEVTLNGNHLYFNEQKPDAVLNLGWFPKEFQGKSNRQLLEQFGIALGGTLAPSSALPATTIKGLVGTAEFTRMANTVGKAWSYRGSVATAMGPGYYSVFYEVPGSARVVEAPVALTPGWYIIRRTINGVVTPLLMYV